MKRNNSFELSVKLSVGQYIPTGSVIHRLDPRVKLIMGMMLVAASIISSSLLSLVFLFMCLIACLAAARIQVKLAVSALKPVLPFLLVLALIQVFAVPQYRINAEILWQWRIFKISDRSLLAGLLLIGRFAVIVLGLSLFSFSTSTTELLHGIEHLLRPLQKIKFPAHELALVLNIAIRFLPILAAETEHLMKAQASRGADFGYGRRNFIKKIRQMLPLFVPLFVQSLRYAFKLVEAMESRCYTGGQGRTYLISMRAGISDFTGLSAGVCVIACALVMSFLKVDLTVLNWAGLI
jgi:energy-coupling factor transport system permease protein